MELSSPHAQRGGSFLTPSPAGRKRRESRNQHDPAGVSSILELIDPSSPTSSGPAFDELRSFFLRTQPSAASVQSRQLDHDFQTKAKLVHDRLISLVDDDAASPGTWATFLLKWCVGLLGALEAKLAGAVGQQTSIEAHLGRLHNLYLASVITRCLAALQTDEPNHDDAAKKREGLDGAEPLAWLFQSAARGPRTLEWLVAFVGLHRPREVMDHLLASIFRDVVEGRTTSRPLSSSSSSSSSSTTTSSTASSSSLSPACFGVHAIEYLAQRHPQHCVDALRAHWARFLRYTAADHAKGDSHLLGFFALVASACPTATQLALPLVLGSLSMATLDRVITREAGLPSHRPENMSPLDLISQVLVAHLPHLGPNAWQLVLLLEALRRKTQFVADDDNSLSHSSLLSRLLLRDEDAAKGDVKMDVEGGEGGAVALPNQALIASGAETLLARTLLVVQDALFDALSSSGLRDRYLDHSLSNDGKSEGRLSFLYHLRQHIGPLVSLALQSQTTQGDAADDADAGSLFELLLVLIGVEGGQKSAGDVLHHLFVVADHRQPPARSRSLSLFLRVRSRFLNYYPDVYRVCVQRVVESMAALADDRLVAVLANFCFLLRADEAAASPPAPQPSLQLSTAALLADHWAQLFGLLYRPALGSAASAVAAPLPPVLFPLLEATVAHLATDGDATLFHTCIEQVLLYFLALLPSTPPATTTTTTIATATATATTTTTTAGGTPAAMDVIPPVEAVKRLIVKMTDAAPQSALPHILDLLFDFIFSPEADGIVRRKREVIRATKPSRPSPTIAAGSSSSTPPVLPVPVSKSVYVPPANAIFQPTTSFFSALPLFSHSHPSSLFLAPSSTTHASSSPPASSSSLSSPSSSSFLSSPAQLRAEPGAAAGTSLLEQNLKRRAHDRKDSRTSLSIFEKTLIKKRKLGFDTDSSHYQDKVLLEAMLLQDNQRHIIDLLSLCVHHNDVERLGVLADLYLARLMRTQDPTPTYEQYKEVLPRRPTFPRDQFVQKIFTQNAILVPLLELIAREPSILYRCLEVIRSLMVYTISHWHAEIAPQPKTSTEFSFTCRLLELLRSAKWVPAPLCYCGEIMGEITPEEITTILLAVWDFLHHSPPSPTHYFVSTYEPKYPQEGDDDKRQPVACNVDPFMRTLRNVLRQNVGKVSLNYARFF